MQPFGEENGLSLADVQPEVSRRQCAVYDANPRGLLQRVEARCGGTPVEGFGPHGSRNHDLAKEDLQ